jgi:hypothetical protein
VDTLQYQRPDQHTYSRRTQKPEHQSFRLLPKRLIRELSLADDLDHAKMQQGIGYLSLAWCCTDWKETSEPSRNSRFYLVLHTFRDQFAIGGGDGNRLVLAAIKKCSDLKADGDRVLAELGNRICERIRAIDVFAMKLLLQIVSGTKQTYKKTAGKTCDGNQYNG